MTNPEVHAEHRWLRKLLGDWTGEAECSMGPDQPKQAYAMAETVRALGGLWTHAEGSGAMPGGGKSATVMTLGFDPVRKKFVGTFVASMMTHLWVYEGELDSDGRELTLTTEGPSFTDPAGTSAYRDVIAFDGDDRRTLRSFLPGPDGGWVEFMTARYERAK